MLFLTLSGDWGPRKKKISVVFCHFLDVRDDDFTFFQGERDGSLVVSTHDLISPPPCKQTLKKQYLPGAAKECYKA